MKRQSEEHSNEFWGIDPDNPGPRTASAMLLPQAKKRKRAGECYVAICLPPRSLIGRYLKRELGLSDEELQEMLKKLLDLLECSGFLRRNRKRALVAYRLTVSCILWWPWRWHSPTAGSRGPKASTKNPKRAPTAISEIFINRNPSRWPRSRRGNIRRRWLRQGSASDANSDSAMRTNRRCPIWSAHPPWSWASISPTWMPCICAISPHAGKLCATQRRAGRQGQPGLIIAYCGAYSFHDQVLLPPSRGDGGGVRACSPLELANAALLRAYSGGMVGRSAVASSKVDR